MTFKALNALKECDKIYAEFYTSTLIGTKVEDLEAVIGKKKPCKKLAVRTADTKATYRDTRTGMTVTGEQLRKGIEIGEFAPDESGWDAKLWHFVKE